MYRSTALLLILASLSADAQAQALTPEAARAAFVLADSVVADDGGELWKHSLAGPMLLVDPSDRAAVTNRPAPAFVPQDGVFVGSLPDSVGIANTATHWADEYWTMLMWPLPEDRADARELIAHELWHRIQGPLGFPSTGPANQHLGTMNGRLWLRMEWQALAAGLTGPDSSIAAAAKDALTFRAARLALFPNAEEDERLLLMHEGLAAYTGGALSGRSPDSARRHTAQSFQRYGLAPTLVRQFAYASGPAYGLLLDRLGVNWREGLSESDDIVLILGNVVHFELPTDAVEEAAVAAERYDWRGAAAEEQARENERLVRLEAQMVRYVTGPVLRIRLQRPRMSFDPGTVDALQGHGQIYGSISLNDVWGTLEVDGGALVGSDWMSVVVPAPTVDSEQVEIRGDGYLLRLEAGWQFGDGDREGDVTLIQKGP